MTKMAIINSVFHIPSPFHHSKLLILACFSTMSSPDAVRSSRATAIRDRSADVANIIGITITLRAFRIISKWTAVHFARPASGVRSLRPAHPWSFRLGTKIDSIRQRC
mmetsp:Transcript_17891/g.49556  ORF Transcript_17891/g.49556 Transcript_17891/m.49556 type:complete len:108 (+) Transcript_17891:101-424(+)